MKKVIFWSLAFPLCAITALYLVGVCLPNEGIRSTSAHLSKSPDIIWRVWSGHYKLQKPAPVTAFNPVSSSLTKVELLQNSNGLGTERHISPYGWRLTYSAKSSSEQTDQIVEMEPLRTGTKLTIVEKWIDRNPLHKLLKHSLIGYRAHMAGIYEAIEKQANEVATNEQRRNRLF